MARSALPNPDKLGRLLLRIVRKKKTCDLDELLGECTSHSWTQVFLKWTGLVAQANCVCPAKRPASISYRYLELPSSSAQSECGHQQRP